MRPRGRMKIYAFVLLLCVYGVVWPAWAQNVNPNPQPSPDEQIHDNFSRLTKIWLTVVDKGGKPVASLSDKDLRVLEDGVPQVIEGFAPMLDVPIRLVLAIDTSLSQERVLEVTQAAAREFVEASLRPDKDRAAVFSFSGRATLKQPLTNNLDAIKHALDDLAVEIPPGYLGGGVVVVSPPKPSKGATTPGSTSIWDAIAAIDQQVFATPSADARRVIILLTDGQDTASRLNKNDAIERTIKAGVVVYAIGIGSEEYGGVDKGTLLKLAERTGGRAFFPKKSGELRAAFAQIQQELRMQYLLVYKPKNVVPEDKYRKLQIEIINPELRKQKIELAYPQGCFYTPAP